jgi:hypothetical protein
MGNEHGYRYGRSVAGRDRGAQAVPLPEANPERAGRTGPAQPPQSSAAPADPPAPRKRPDPETIFNWTEALAPVVDFELAKADRDNLKSAVRAIYAERFADARAAMQRIGNEHARKVARWYYYRSDGLDADAVAIEKFRTANPEWPSQDRLRRNAERALFLQRADAETVNAFFAESAPKTGAGKAAQAAARTIKARLVAFAAEHWGVPQEQIEFLPGRVRVGNQEILFRALIWQAYLARIPLPATGFYNTPLALAPNGYSEMMVDAVLDRTDPAALLLDTDDPTATANAHPDVRVGGGITADVLSWDPAEITAQVEARFRELPESTFLASGRELPPDVHPTAVHAVREGYADA